MENESLFTVNESGEIEYNSENEVLVDGSTENGSVGDEVGTSLPDTEILSEDSVSSEIPVDTDIPSDDSVLYSGAPVAVYTVGSAVGGSLSSTTLDYFDRVVDGLPSDYGYVAYKTSNEDGYAGSLIYGRDYDVSDNNIVFGKGAVELALSRYQQGNYNYYVYYDTRDAENASVSLPSSGTLLYYTNLVDGRPTLGRGARPFEISPYIVVALIAVLASCILGRIIKGR